MLLGDIVALENWNYIYNQISGISMEVNKLTFTIIILVYITTVDQVLHAVIVKVITQTINEVKHNKNR